MDYSISRFSSSHASTDSDMTALPSTSYPRTKLETTFCRNFKCCGQGLENLHDLLQHYEESHVKFEDDDMPAMVADDDNASAASSSASSSQPPSPKNTNAAAAKSTDTFEGSSAFDTTIMRSTPNKGGKKRSFGQFSNGNGTTANVHQSLRRALIDGGVGRGSSTNASSIYSANSPFSTPGSSIPGTPTMDTDNETAFFGNGTSSIPAFSSLSIRGSTEDLDLPSCAPPNLFFPAAGSSSSLTTQPPAKRERINSINSAISASGLDGVNGGPLGDRPYKCQSLGCDKAYKQMNGLKYHRLHGQCNQNNLPAQQQISNVTADSTTATTSQEASAVSTKPSPASSSSNGSGEVIEAKSAAKVSNPTTSSALASAIAAAAAAMMIDPSSTITAEPLDISTPSPPGSAPPSPRSSPESINGDLSKADRHYICQVGHCGKRYKNLNGLRYHYLHSGSHGLLGLQLLHTNGGGPSARADASTGRPAISTNDLSSAALAAAAQAAAAQQQANQRGVAMQKQQE